MRSARAAARNGAEDALAIPDEAITDLLSRLSRVEGQVRAIRRMIEERRDCHAIAQQMGAANAALSKATVQLMISSMAQCISAKGGRDDAELARLTESFSKLLR